jgi:hypothetical protein
MALRLYALRNPLSGLAIGVTANRGPWGGTPSPHELSLDKTAQITDGPVLTSGSVTGVAGAKFALITLAYLVPSNVALSGTIDLCFPTYGGADPVAVDCHWCCHAYVHVGTTGLLRGTLLDNYSEPTGATNALREAPGFASQFVSPQAITAVTAMAGDYIVVEIAAVMWTAPASTGRVIGHGTKSLAGAILPDLAAGDAYDTTNGSGSAWIEFALVPTPIPVDDSDPDCCTTAPGQSSGVDTDATSWTPTCAGGGAVPTAATPATAESWAA